MVDGSIRTNMHVVSPARGKLVPGYQGGKKMGAFFSMPGKITELIRRNAAYRKVI